MRLASTGADAERSRSTGALTFSPLLQRYAIAIGAAEFVLAFVDPLLGMILYTGILGVAVTQYALKPVDMGRRILPGLALVPLLRVQSLVMPIEDLPRILWYVLAGVPVLIAITLSARALQLKSTEIGLGLPRNPWADGLAALSGVPLGWIAYQAPIERLPIEGGAIADVVVIATVLLVFVAFLEELLFRGVLQRLANQVSGPVGPVIITVIYATLFISSYSIALVGLMTLSGAIFAWAIQRGSSLVGVTVGHSLMLLGGMVAPALFQ